MTEEGGPQGKEGDGGQKSQGSRAHQPRSVSRRLPQGSGDCSISREVSLPQKQGYFIRLSHSPERTLHEIFQVPLS